MKYIYTFFYIIFCIFLFWFIIHYVSNNFIIIENFDPTYSAYDINTPLTSHSVDLPINTTTSCKNMCGPNAQCSITREQCTSDVDCYGCQPPPPVIYNNNSKPVIGDNDAGKLTFNQTPQYSVLTTDIGTEAAYFNGPKAKVPQPYLGIDKWTTPANIGMQYFYKAYNYQYITEPDKFINLPKYPVHESATGLFLDIGPLPSNA